MYGVKNLSAVIPRATFIANAYYDSFKNDEPLLVLERLSGNFFGANSAVAVLTRVAVRSFISGIC